MDKYFFLDFHTVFKFTPHNLLSQIEQGEVISSW